MFYIIETCTRDKKIGVYRVCYHIENKYYLLRDADNIIKTGETKEELEYYIPINYFVDTDGYKHFSNCTNAKGVQLKYWFTNEVMDKLKKYMRKFFQFKNLNRADYIKAIKIVSPEILNIIELERYDGINIKGSYLDMNIIFNQNNKDIICVPNHVVDVDSGFGLFNGD